MTTTQSEFSSNILGNCRDLWIREPIESFDPRQILILLDGEYYRKIPDFCKMFDSLESSKLIPATRVVLVSHLDDSKRWTESFCNLQFASALVEELFPQVVPMNSPVKVILGGLSLTGLQAAFTTLRFPERFDALLCQSPSFWWNDAWLVKEYRRIGVPDLVYSLCVGGEETSAPVDHGDGLVQKILQIVVCRQFRDLLRENQQQIYFEEYSGGHRLEDWARMLPKSLVEISSKIHSPETQAR